MNRPFIDFISRDCKSNLHEWCGGTWHGLGHEVVCDCTCHKNKKKHGLVAGIDRKCCNSIRNSGHVVVPKAWIGKEAIVKLKGNRK